MANELKMANIQSILTLNERGWSNRRIARELGIHRDTVGRHLHLALKDAAAGELGGSKPAKAPPGSTPRGRKARSACAPFRQIIEAKLDQGLTAKRIHQDLIAEHGFASEYHSVRRFVRALGQTTPLPMRRMECSPGE
ncbi:MAG: helix-turn-helix domain-containing protein, partial [Kiritimatiellia bacterium]|nr:helix-turn-helix domain-containing protein [Kiritimatiellia bacterium]